jgi:hypothetical protein
MDQFDQQRTGDENAKRGVQFVLKPTPNSAGPASGPTSSNPGLNQTYRSNESPAAPAMGASRVSLFG